ncbi:hypothetical protein HYX13_02895 [Candidatus Woesearchaeota archaeon]|nr:hypothetical protein [Candidatus Woesearchaeota archaeon]
MSEKSFKEELSKEVKEDFKQNKFALITGVGMKTIIFILAAIALVLVIIILAVQLLIFILPFLLIVALIWFIIRYFNRFKTRKIIKNKVK